MASSSDTLELAGESLTLVLSGSGRADNCATFSVSGNFSGLTLRCYASNDGNTFDLVAPYQHAGKVWESQTETAGFSVPGSTSRAWTVYAANRASVKFVVGSINGAVTIRADSSYQLGMEPPGAGAVYDPLTGSVAATSAATADTVATTAVPLVALGLLDVPAGTLRRQRGDGSGAALVTGVGEQADTVRLAWLELWRIRKLLDLGSSSDSDDIYPPGWSE